MHASTQAHVLTHTHTIYVVHTYFIQCILHKSFELLVVIDVENVTQNSGNSDWTSPS